MTSGMVVPGGKRGKPAGLAGAQGRDMGAIYMEGPVPDSFDQLFGFVTPFRPRVYSTPHARVMEETSPVVGGRHVPHPGGEWGHGKKGVLGTVGPGQSLARGSAI